MGQYERVSKLTGMLPDDKECRNLETKAKQRLKEQNTGKYDWFAAYKNARKPIPDVDIANYQGPVEIKEPVDGIRGLFVTQDVKAGELLVCHVFSPFVRIANWLSAHVQGKVKYARDSTLVPSQEERQNSGFACTSRTRPVDTQVK